jgi:hypothetical protein
LKAYKNIFADQSFSTVFQSVLVQMSVNVYSCANVFFK